MSTYSCELFWWFWEEFLIWFCSLVLLSTVLQNLLFSLVYSGMIKSCVLDYYLGLSCVSSFQMVCDLVLRKLFFLMIVVDWLCSWALRRWPMKILKQVLVQLFWMILACFMLFPSCSLFFLAICIDRCVSFWWFLWTNDDFVLCGIFGGVVCCGWSWWDFQWI